MSSEYRIDIRDTTGVLVATCTNYNDLTYTKKVNEVSIAQFTIDGNDKIVSLLGLDYQVEFWRRNLDMGVPWACDFYGLYRGSEQKNVKGLELFTATCLSQSALLARRIVGYYAGYNLRSKFTAVAPETIAKNLVSYNIGASATTGNGRYRTGTMSAFTVNIDTDLGRGSAQSWECANQNLMKTLQDLAKASANDFDLVRTGATTWTFYWYPGQLGTDRHATVNFGLKWGNMQDPVYALDRTAEKTVAIVGGQGAGAVRPIQIRTGGDYAAAHDIEEFVNATNYTTLAGLNAEGDRAMYLDRARSTFNFKALQLKPCYYGAHYFLGDIVSASYKGFSSASEKIIGVTVSFNAQDFVEHVVLDMMNV